MILRIYSNYTATLASGRPTASLNNIKKNEGPNIDPCGTPVSNDHDKETVLSVVATPLADLPYISIFLGQLSAFT